MAEPSKGGGILIGAAKPPAEKAKPKEGGAMSAARALLSAIKAGDAGAADEALRLHYELCKSESAEDADE
jgi:DNA-binding GntR family transcriptional regulator